MERVVEKDRRIESHCVGRGIYPYQYFATQMPNGLYVLSNQYLDNCGDILNGADENLYLGLGKPYWQGDGIPDDMELAYGQRGFTDDAFLGIGIELDERTGEFQLGNIESSSISHLVKDCRGYGSENLRSVHTPFRDKNCRVDWQALMEEIGEKFACSVPLNISDRDMIDRKVNDARLHRLRVLLWKFATLNWESDVDSFRSQRRGDWEWQESRHGKAKIILERSRGGSAGQICALLKEYGVPDEMLQDVGMYPGLTRELREDEREPVITGYRIVDGISLVRESVENARREGHSVVEMPRPVRSRFEEMGSNLIYDHVEVKRMSIAKMYGVMIDDLRRGLVIDLRVDHLITMDDVAIGSLLSSVRNALTWRGQGIGYDTLKIASALGCGHGTDQSKRAKIAQFIFARLSAHSYFCS